jgi:hypothetical protein
MAMTKAAMTSAADCRREDIAAAAGCGLRGNPKLHMPGLAAALTDI